MTSHVNRLFYKPGFDKPIEPPRDIEELITPTKKKTKVVINHANHIPQFEDFVDFRQLIGSTNGNANGYITQEKNNADLKDPQSSNQSDLVEANLKLEHFIPMDKFQSLYSNEIGEILTIAVEQFPSSTLHSSYLAEDLINTIIQLIKEMEINDSNGEKLIINPDYTWSFNNSDYLEMKTVFIKFDDILTLYLFVSLSNDLEYESHKAGETQKITVHTNNFTKDALNVLEEKISNIEEIETAELKDKIVERISKLRSFPAKSTSSSGTGNIDQLLAMYSKDKIDPQELVAVPSEMVDTIKQNIVDFRTHVLRIEKQKREQQMLKEKRKSRIRLKEMVSNLRNANGAPTSDLPQLEEVSSDEEGDSNSKDEITDEEYEAKRKAAEENRVARIFSQRLQSTRRRDSARKENYNNYMKSIKSDVYYNSVVPSAREKFLNLFVTPVTDANNTMDKNRAYYTNHSNYLSHRKNKRLDEEKLDQKDREEEEKESAVTEDAQEFMSTFEPVKIVLKKKDQDQVEDVNKTIPDSLVPQIEKKVEEVIEEYLGMKEDSLITFIVDFVRTQYYSSRDTDAYKSFMNELSETLDEDAETAMTDVLNFVKELV